MKTIMKLSMSNILSNKARSLLIIISLGLSFALVFTVLSISSVTEEVFKDNQTRFAGNTDAIMTPKDSQGGFIQDLTKEQMDKVKGMTTYQIPNIIAYGYNTDKDYTQVVALNGIDLDDYGQIYAYDFVSKSDNDFVGDMMIISEKTAESLSLEVGDSYDITSGSETLTYTVWGIITEGSMLDKNPNLIQSIVPKSRVRDIMDIGTGVSVYYLDLEEGLDIENSVEILNEYFEDYQVDTMMDLSSVNNTLNMITTLLGLMTLTVLLISSFIIYSSFKVITIDRMPFIGTIRSLGGKKKDTNRVMLVEGMLYSLLGSILGLVLGVIAMKVTLNQLTGTMSVDAGSGTVFNPIYGLIAFVAVAALVILSSISPIRKVSKQPIKSLLFTEIDGEKHYSKVRLLVGAAMLVGAFVLLNIKPKGLEIAFDAVASVLAIFACVCFIPFITWIVSTIFGFLLKPFLSHHAQAASVQIRQDKTLLNNVVLLAIGLGVILMINNFSTSVSKLVTMVYDQAQVDVAMFYEQYDESLLESLENVEGIDAYYVLKNTLNATANDGEILLPYLEAFESVEVFNETMWDYIENDNIKALDRSFSESRGIILTEFIADKYDLEIGDTIALDTPSGPVDYEVIHTHMSLINNGNVSYIHSDYFSQDLEIDTYGSLFIQSDRDYDELILDIKQENPMSMMPLISIDEQQANNEQMNESIFMMMRAISLLAMLIGAIGIFNNYFISFISRRKFFASLKSLGVSKAGVMKLLITEAIFTGIAGVSAGLLTGFISLNVMVYTLEDMGIESSLMTYEAGEFIFVAISGIILALVGAIIPSLSMRNRPVVADLKYD